MACGRMRSEKNVVTVQPGHPGTFRQRLPVQRVKKIRHYITFHTDALTARLRWPSKTVRRRWRLPGIKSRNGRRFSRRLPSSAGTRRPAPAVEKSLTESFPQPSACRALARTWRDRAGPDKKLRRFSKRLLKDYAAPWLFANVEGVEPTHHHAERCLRPAVMWRKRSFGNHSAAGCRFTERRLTGAHTLKLQKRPVFEYLKSALRNHRAGHSSRRAKGP